MLVSFVSTLGDLEVPNRVEISGAMEELEHPFPKFEHSSS